MFFNRFIILLDINTYMSIYEHRVGSFCDKLKIVDVYWKDNGVNRMRLYLNLIVGD